MNRAMMMKEREAQLNKIFEERDMPYRVQYDTILKDDQIKDAYCLRCDGYNAGPILYYDTAWWQKNNEELIVYIMHIMNETEFHLPIEPYTRREYILDNVMPRVSNQEYVENYDAKDVAYVRIFDLLVSFYIPVKETEQGMSSIKVKHDLLHEAKIALEELLMAAQKNIAKEARIFPMQSMIPEIPEIDPDVEDERPMYVLTNRTRINGAAAMINSDVLQSISNQIGNESIYIIPSSIHEVICVPVNKDFAAGPLLNLVHKVNQTLDSTTKLSDSIYLYDSHTLKAIHR